MSHDKIILTRVSEHNLKNISIEIPHDAITVVSGVSGSGKSSLVFDTLYKECRRRYFETFSTHARQFMGKLGRPAAERMENLSPALAVDQKNIISNPRSVVGSISELYDFLRLLFARLGRPAHLNESQQEELRRSMFSFNSPHGACPTCSGLGVQDAIDPELLISDPEKTLRQGALRLTTPNGYIIYSQVTMEVLNQVCLTHGFSVDIPWRDLTPEQKHIVLNGSTVIKIPFGKHPLESRLKWTGITPKPREEGYYKGILPIMENILRTDHNPNILRFARVQPCGECHGTRINAFARSILFHERPIHRYAALTLEEFHRCFLEMRPNSGNAREKAVLEPIREAMLERTAVMLELGLGYLTLDRESTTLSGGEAQRLRLAVQAAGRLRGVCLILDEPSIGLHHRDNLRLLRLLQRLKNNGNTLVVVEHDEDTIRAADGVIDIGPGSGVHGGEILYSGAPAPLCQYSPENENQESPSPLSRSRTAAFLSRNEVIHIPASRRPGNGHFLTIQGACRHNLKNISVSFPLAAMTVVTGVSGAGKSTLTHDVLGDFLEKHLNGGVPDYRETTVFRGYELLDKIIRIDQSPIGKTPRSNPATYTKVFDHVRDLFATLPEALACGFDKSRFSFNLSGGRCEACEGAGLQETGMHFLGSVSIVCEECGGRRFNESTLAIRYRGKNICDVLEMSISESLTFFSHQPKITRILQVLTELGLGYLSLGQSSATLSGGEAQRVKLAAELSRPATGRTLYILDEPTSGLHMADIKILLECLDRLIDMGNTVIVVEHHPDVILRADHVIDLGPEGGEGGGSVTAAGAPETIALCQNSHTGAMLRERLARKKEEKPPLTAHPAPSAAKTAPSAPAPIRLEGVCTHNLKDIDLNIPLNTLTVITGVSGSGKSSLAFDTIFAEGRRRFLGGMSTYARYAPTDIGGGQFRAITGLPPTIAISQNRSRINHNPRSTVGTMTEIYDYLRLLFSRSGIPHCPVCRLRLQNNACPDGHYSAPPIPILSSLFSFNHHLGACPSCKGLGVITGCDPEKLISYPYLPLCCGAMNASKTGKLLGDPFGRHMAILDQVGREHGMDFSQPWSNLPPQAQRLALYGTGEQKYHTLWRFRRKNRTGEHGFETRWEGLLAYVNDEYRRKHADARGESMTELMSDIICPQCRGDRLNPASLGVLFHNRSIAELTRLSTGQLLTFFTTLPPEPRGETAASVIIPQITRRLSFLNDLGLGCLTLARNGATLSGGERQRIRLAGQLGSGLTRVTYILDEPTVGLHARDTQRLISLLRNLRDQGNTVIVVEHDMDVIAAADHIIELGPGAGEDGGYVIATGAPADLAANITSKTGRYFREGHAIPTPSQQLSWEHEIMIRGACAHNLKHIDLHIPASRMTVISGVSGSGKSSLLFDVIAASAASPNHQPRGCREISGLDYFGATITVDQSPLSGASAACPATVTGIFDTLRELLAQTPTARRHGFNAGYFSLNRKGGRCESCQGSGREDIPMDFLADTSSVCENCGGQRYNAETLDITLNGKNAAEILNMTVSQAQAAFSAHPTLPGKLALLEETGLGFLRLGQPLETLSGGEIQRLKLATELMKGRNNRRLYLLDEPSTGLHAEDVERLLRVFRRLCDEGHTLLIIEHHPDIIASADYILDLGPEGGEGGGALTFAGVPAAIAQTPDSPTGRILAERFMPRSHGDLHPKTEHSAAPLSRTNKP